MSQESKGGWAGRPRTVDSEELGCLVTGRDTYLAAPVHVLFTPKYWAQSQPHAQSKSAWVSHRDRLPREVPPGPPAGEGKALHEPSVLDLASPLRKMPASTGLGGRRELGSHGSLRFYPGVLSAPPSRGVGALPGSAPVAGAEESLLPERVTLWAARTSAGPELSRTDCGVTIRVRGLGLQGGFWPQREISAQAKP